ncbi:MAG: hypothetical protein IT381_01915 [Deltaproteobacteria bacterium]|nr:hypothetical protein [Deltaproteobacteria bacterium]
MYSLIAQWLSLPAQATLAEVQRALEAQNGLGEQPPVVAFLITSQERSALPGCNPSTNEQVFVTEGDEPRLGVFIAESVLEALPLTASALSLADVAALDGYCVAFEGVSHFLCLAHRADRERSVSLFELELQAEVDKFVHLTQKLAIEPGSPAQHALLETLFERYALRDDLSAIEAARYREATRHAAKFCHRLSKAARAEKSNAVVFREARSFFDLPLEAKLRRAA